MDEDEPFAGIDWDDIREPANPLPLLQKWYLAQCDGHWERSNRIEIASLDNAGWRIKIPLRGTFLDEKPFAPVEETFSGSPSSNEPDGMTCWVEDQAWHATGGPKRLNKMLLTFLHWAADVAPGWPTRVGE